MTTAPRLGIARYSLGGMRTPWTQPRHVLLPSPSDHSHSISTTGQLTISVRMRPDSAAFTGEGSTADYCWPIAKGAASGFYEYGLRFYSSHSSNRASQLSCYAYNPTGGLGAGARWASPLSAGTWYHVAAVYDLRRDRIALYVDGAEATSGERIFEFQGDRIVPEAKGAPLYIGKRGNGAEFVGSLADLRIFDTALSHAEVRALAAEPML